MSFIKRYGSKKVWGTSRKAAWRQSKRNQRFGFQTWQGFKRKGNLEVWTIAITFFFICWIIMVHVIYIWIRNSSSCEISEALEYSSLILCLIPIQLKQEQQYTPQSSYQLPRRPSIRTAGNSQSHPWSCSEAQWWRSNCHNLPAWSNSDTGTQMGNW